jgi:hypothetical protein
MILHGPVLPDSRTPERQGRRQSTNGFQITWGRDDRSADAGCTHTDSVGPELPRDSLSCQSLAIISSVLAEN